MNIVLWVIQVLLSLVFLMAGAVKTFVPLATVRKRLPWAKHFPAWVVRFVGISELLGALGLILPGITHIAPLLTVAAAVGLVLVMILAAIYHAPRREFSSVGSNIILLLLAAFIVVGRLLWLPL